MFLKMLSKIKQGGVMKIIKSIEIRYFRSIYHLKINNVEDCIVFSGKNDSGKSNVLKALNLFFNGYTDWNQEIDFYKDFNFSRLSEVREKSVKGKQFIQVAITFRRGKSSVNSLPEFFTVRKQWDRYGHIKTSDDLEPQLAKGKIKNTNINIIRRSLTGYLNKIKFEYVPAIKDEKVFKHVLRLLQEDIISISLKRGQEIRKDILNVSKKFQSNVMELASEFQKSTGVDTNVRLPVEISELFQSLNVYTKTGLEDEYDISINKRGDGIRLRYLPSIYYFLAENHNGNFILAFEEPENSMEYNLSTQMAKDFQLVYSKKAQIFITSHSSAFLFDYSNSFALYRIYKTKAMTNVAKLKITEDSLQIIDNKQEDYKLIEDIGLISLQKLFHKDYQARVEEIKIISEKHAVLQKHVEASNKPVVFTEGKTDVLILKTAWEKLYTDKAIPFEIFPVETTAFGGGDGGYSALTRRLESVREDENLQIGIYDNDYAGNDKGFIKLNNNFSFLEKSKYIKVHKNKRAAAILLPVVPGLEEFENYKNLAIEFYFSEIDLNKKVNGKSLELESFFQPVQRYGVEIASVKRDDLYLSKIVSNSKKYFAETIVPTLPKKSFCNFSLLFEEILFLIKNYK